jgi:hypothetical protein
MNHLEQIKVKFVGAKSRTNPESKNKYYRNVFLHDGKYYSVMDGDDLSGKAGVVQFVKKGEDNMNGGKVAQDAFSLVFASSAGTASAAKLAFEELSEG